LIKLYSVKCEQKIRRMRASTRVQVTKFVFSGYLLGWINKLIIDNCTQYAITSVMSNSKP